MLGRGRGNEITYLPPLPASWLVLVSPSLKLSTKWVYDNFDFELTEDTRDFKMFIEAAAGRNMHLVRKSLFNRLEEVVVPKYPVIGEIKGQLLREGASGALMTGSGSSVFAFAPDEDRAKEIARRISTMRKEDKICAVRTT